ncbi:MAG: hypothetical protein MMC23_000598 [Stictis urceolatum]|nr:hypothetical protein [Stictis urceolata]
MTVSRSTNSGVSKDSPAGVQSTSRVPESAQHRPSNANKDRKALDTNDIDYTKMSEEDLLKTLAAYEEPVSSGTEAEQARPQEFKSRSKAGGFEGTSVVRQAQKPASSSPPRIAEPGRFFQADRSRLGVHTDPRLLPFVEKQQALKDASSHDGSILGGDDAEELFVPQEPKPRMIGKAERLEPLDESLVVPLKKAERDLKRGLKHASKKPTIKTVSAEDQEKADKAHREALRQEKSDRTPAVVNSAAPKTSREPPATSGGVQASNKSVPKATSTAGTNTDGRVHSKAAPNSVASKFGRNKNALATYGPAVPYPVTLISKPGREKLSTEEFTENKRRSAFNHQEKKRSNRAATDKLTFVPKTYTSKLAGYPADSNTASTSFTSTATADISAASNAVSSTPNTSFASTASSSNIRTAPPCRGLAKACAALPIKPPASAPQSTAKSPPTPPSSSTALPSPTDAPQMGLKLLKPRERPSRHKTFYTTLEDRQIGYEARDPTASTAAAPNESPPSSAKRKSAPSPNAEDPSRATQRQKRNEQAQELADFKLESAIRARQQQLARLDSGTMGAAEQASILSTSSPARTDPVDPVAPVAVNDAVAPPIGDDASSSSSVPSEEGETVEEYQARVRAVKARRVSKRSGAGGIDAAPYGIVGAGQPGGLVPARTESGLRLEKQDDVQGKAPKRLPAPALRARPPAWIRTAQKVVPESAAPETQFVSESASGGAAPVTHVSVGSNAVDEAELGVKSAVVGASAPLAVSEQKIAGRFPRLEDYYPASALRREGRVGIGRSPPAVENVPGLTPDEESEEDRRGGDDDTEELQESVVGTGTTIQSEEEESQADDGNLVRFSTPTGIQERPEGAIRIVEYTVRYTLHTLSPACAFPAAVKNYGPFQNVQMASGAAENLFAMMKQEITRRHIGSDANSTDSAVRSAGLPTFSFIDDDLSVCVSVCRKTVWRIPESDVRDEELVYYEIQQRMEVLSGWFAGETRGIQQVSHGSYGQLDRANEVAHNVWGGVIGQVAESVSDGERGVDAVGEDGEGRGVDTMDLDTGEKSNGESSVVEEHPALPEEMDIDEDDDGGSAEGELFWRSGIQERVLGNEDGSDLQDTPTGASAKMRQVRFHVWVEKKVLKGT